MCSRIDIKKTIYASVYVSNIEQLRQLKDIIWKLELLDRKKAICAITSLGTIFCNYVSPFTLNINPFKHSGAMSIDRWSKMTIVRKARLDIITKSPLR